MHNISFPNKFLHSAYSPLGERRFVNLSRCWLGQLVYSLQNTDLEKISGQFRHDLYSKCLVETL